MNTSTTSPKELCAHDIMSRDLITIPLDFSLGGVANIFCENGISGAPVVDEAGNLAGVISKSDLIKHDAEAATRVVSGPATYFRTLDDETLQELDPDRFHEEDLESARVIDVYTDNVITATTTTPLPSLAKMMVLHGIHRIIILDGESPVGVVTSMDLLRRLASLEGWMDEPTA